MGGIITNVIAFTSLRFTFHSHLLSYPLLVVLSIDYRCFSFVSLSIVVVDAFVFICGCCWCVYACLGSGLVPLFLQSVVAVLVWSLDWCLSSFCGRCWCLCARLSVLLPCSRLLLVPCCCDLAVVLSLFACLWLLLWSLLVLLCSSFGAPAFFQAAPDAVLLWSGCCPWSVCLSVVATGALVLFVIAAGTSVVAFGRRWYFSRSFSRKHVGLHLSFLLDDG